MNYIAEINAFYRWLGSNSLKGSAIALWHALMSIASDASHGADWQLRITPSVATLQSRSGLSKDAIITARNQLKQAGRIDWKERGGSAATAYTIIPFASGFATQIPAQTSMQIPTQIPAQTSTQLPPIYKQNQTKQNKVCGGRAREEQSAEFGLSESQVADLRRIGEAYEADIGAIPSSAMEGFREYYLERGISADVVIKAIQAAAENNARRWPYIRSILERCVTEQVLTLEDWRQAELRKQSRKSGGNSGKGQAGHGSSYDIDELERMIEGDIL